MYILHIHFENLCHCLLAVYTSESVHVSWLAGWLAVLSHNIPAELSCPFVLHTHIIVMFLS